jgi:hypothetical protein
LYETKALAKFGASCNQFGLNLAYLEEGFHWANSFGQLNRREQRSCLASARVGPKRSFRQIEKDNNALDSKNPGEPVAI